ncbi:hypothetical protein [Streptomyces sp. MP131-18]|uniref:hypothetical protein n=1 Tax=Streptomyces sp. MP131-18 TaxID=1857892 RepID=UPI00097C81D7|nr:hypothetical protein [Streptomyces sp. MP131-18]ONK15155.1 hypothetical protein STBA_59700 [Streptomyces sp. MP131-18]
MVLSRPRTPTTYCSTATLRARGWTPSLMRAFLGGPDLASPTELFLVSRVREAERSPEFTAARGLLRRRAEALRQARARRRDLALAAIREAPLDLPLLSPPELTDRAIRHRNLRDAQRAVVSFGHRPRPATADSAQPRELARWRVEYLRDALAPHGSLLDALPPGDCRAEGRRLLTERVFHAIAAAYPALAVECRRQRAAALAG